MKDSGSNNLFKVGDRVKVVSDSNDYFIGMEATIKEVIDADMCYWLDFSFLPNARKLASSINVDMLSSKMTRGFAINEVVLVKESNVIKLLKQIDEL